MSTKPPDERLPWGRTVGLGAQCPKFGATVSATSGGVLGGITVILYGMIGLVGAKIWVENGVDFGNPVNMVGLAAGLIAGIGGVSLTFGKNFELSGIALGTILVIGYYHLVNGRAGAGSGRVTRVMSHPGCPDGSEPRAHGRTPGRAHGAARPGASTGAGAGVM